MRMHSHNALMTAHGVSVSSLRFLWEPEFLTGATVNVFSNQRLALSFRRWDYSSILRVAVSPIHKYRSEQSLYFYRHSLRPNVHTIHGTLPAVNSIENYYYYIEFRMDIMHIGDAGTVLK